MLGPLARAGEGALRAVCRVRHRRDRDLVSLGIFIVLLVEIAEVTPPAGFNLFVLRNMTGGDSNHIAKASLPFFACLVVCTAIITVFPDAVTWLPDSVMGKAKS